MAQQIKDDIQRILRMNREGRLSDEQTSELLSALLESGDATEPGRPRSDPDRQTAPPPFSMPRGAGAFIDMVRDAVGGAFNTMGVTHGQAGGDNTVTMSRFVPPTGEGFTFSGNTVNVSAVAGLKLRRAQVTGNSFNAAKLSGVEITDGAMTGSTFNGSALSECAIEKGFIDGCTVSGTKITRLRLEGDSGLRGCEIQGAAIKALTLTDMSQMVGCTLQGLSINDLRLGKAMLHDVELQGATVSDTQIVQSEWKDVELQGIRLEDGAAFTRCHLDKVRFTSNPLAGRSSGLRAAQWTDCRLANVTFRRCWFERTTIRNVDLKDLVLEDVSLTDQQIDGTDAFLKAVGQR